MTTPRAGWLPVAPGPDHFSDNRVKPSEANGSTELRGKPFDVDAEGEDVLRMRASQPFEDRHHGPQRSVIVPRVQHDRPATLRDGDSLRQGIGR